MADHPTDHQPGSKTGNPITLAAALAAGTAAYGVLPAGAESVRFEAGGYSWANTTLDITRSASAQYAGYYNYNPTGNEIYFGYSELSGGIYQSIVARSFYTEGGPDAARVFQGDGPGGSLTSIGRGAIIGPGGLDASGFTAAAGPVYRSEILYYRAYDMFPGAAEFTTGFVTDGSAQYLGVQLSINGATHYGWVSFAFMPRNVIYGEQFYRLELLAWGYETEAGVAIAAGVPGPASLGVLAIGAAGALGRRKRAG